MLYNAIPLLCLFLFFVSSVHNVAGYLGWFTVICADVQCGSLECKTNSPLVNKGLIHSMNIPVPKYLNVYIPF